MRRLLPILALSTLFAATAALAAPHPCPDGLRSAMTAQLFFGRSTPDAGEVTDADWSQFVDTEITPRFPDGLSVDDVYGQWRNPKGDFVREQSKALFLVLTGVPAERKRIDLVRDAYKQRFHQDSVMLVEQSACVAF